MLPGDQTVHALREALKVSPDNVPLRLHLAETLLGLGRAEDAEKELRQALAIQGDNPQLKTALARSFYDQGKASQAAVILEDLVKLRDVPPGALVLHARLLLGEGKAEQAVRQYRRAIEIDPKAADAELSDRLGVVPVAQGHEGDTASNDQTGEVTDGRVRATWEGEAQAPNIQVERPKLTFKDVGGMESLKDEIRMKIIYPMAHPELYKAYGKPIGGGILMYGPPGCGKTYLARATAGEIKAAFLAVGISDVLDMWIGSSEKNLHELFEQARRNKPCVLFFDEVDALAASRADMRTHGGRHLINQFLAELDGIESANEGVLVLAATNAPWHVDAAFRRPGRFDRILFVPPPDVAARAAILRILCHGKPVEAIDYDYIAKKAEHFSGADLKAAMDMAIEAKLREAMKSGMPKPISGKDLTAAAATVKASTREWFSTARNYALYSNQGGVYDDIIKYLKM